MVFVEIKVFVFIFVAFMFLVDFGFTQAIISQSIDITIKGANVTKHDEYLCSAHRLPVGDTYIVQFDAIEDIGQAHHILLFGCKEPARTTPTWHCGQICKSSEQILFAWAKNAPPLILPKDVGFHVSGNSDVQYVVIQIHYAKPLPKNAVKTDNSGIRLHVTSQKQFFEAGIFLLLSYSTVIRPHLKKVHSDISCEFKASGNIYPFGYRTHAHSLSRVITGYQVNNTYNMIGKGNPQWPQSFYPVTEKIVIKPGDRLVGRCTYDSTSRSKNTYIGATANDEMCNFYIMYYTPVGTRVPSHTCAGNNIPSLINSIPADSDVQLPPNPKLEAVAHGHHGHMGSPEGHDGPSTTTSTSTKTTPHLTPKLAGNKYIGQSSVFGSALPKVGNVNLNSEGLMGQIAGVTTDKQGNIYVFHRADRVWDGSSFDFNGVIRNTDKPIATNTIVIYNKDGQIIRQLGRNMFFMPHGIEVDANNNIWVTDVGLHQVLRIPAGKDKPDFVLGEKFVPGSDLKHFCKPSDVIVLKTGEFFVSDGYCNSRIIKYDKDGKMMKIFGAKNSGKTGPDGYPMPGQFNVPHSMTYVEDRGWLCVADRENGRIQCFDLNGDFQKQYHPKEFGSRLFAVEYCNLHGGLLFAVNGPSGPNNAPVQGIIVDMETAETIETFNTPQGLQNPHDVAVDPVNLRTYVVELNPYTVWKFDMNSDYTRPMTTSSISSSTSTSTTTTRTQATTKTTILPEKKVLPKDDMMPAFIIGGLLIIPVIIIIIVIILVRMRKANNYNLTVYSILQGDLATNPGQYNCCRQHKSRSRKKFNLGNFLSPHKGFDRLSMEESDTEFDPLNDSEEEEYSLPRKA